MLFIVRWANFSGAGWIGISTYYEQQWPNLIRFVHESEFYTDGMAPCPGGKYFQETVISQDYREVDCASAVLNEKGPLNEEMLVTLMWEQ